ncbi:MAG: hypothetical protein HOV94_32835 [Saccharothrix sp.]|nr:hypothetical protein [Saccharothrix sp.]
MSLDPADVREGTRGWELVPLVLIRSTGFSASMLDAVRTPDAAQACDRVVSLRRRVAELRAQFGEELFPTMLARESARGADRGRFKEWYRLRRRIERGGMAYPLPAVVGTWPDVLRWVQDWNSLLVTVDRATEEAAATTEQDCRLARQRLRELVADERFGEAVFLSSPSMHVGLRRYLDTPEAEQRPRLRSREQKLYGYLQRFTAKNETTSFFGPVDYAVVDDEPHPSLRMRATAGGTPALRRSRLAYWAVQELTDAVTSAEGIRAFLPTRLADTWHDDGAALVNVVSGRRVSRTAPPPEATERRLLLPTDEPDPLGWLRDWVAGLPAECADRTPALHVLDTFKILATRYTTAPVDEKIRVLAETEELFHRTTGADPRRGGGAMFADRTLFYDEAVGDLTTVIGQSMVHDIRARIRPALDLCVTFSTIVQRVCVRRAAEVALRLGGGGPVPYLAFVREMVTTVTMADCLADPEVAGFTERLTELARARTAGGRPADAHTADGRIVLDEVDLAPLLVRPPAGTAVSPDIFLLAGSVDDLTAGAYDVVIGEIHYGYQVWTHLLSFWSAPEWLAEQIGLRLPPDHDRIASLVHKRKQGKAFPKELPGLSVEMGGRSRKPAEQVVRAADLEVVPTGGGPALRSLVDGRPVRLHPGDPRNPVSWVFGTTPVISPSIRLGERTPRVQVGRAVLQRAHWRIDPASLEPARSARRHESMILIRELAGRIGLPRRFFVRVPGERKPFFVDLDSVIGIDYLLAMTAGQDAADITEVLPDTGDWWLPAAGGGRRSCEWRMTWIHGGGDG